MWRRVEVEVHHAGLQLGVQHGEDGAVGGGVQEKDVVWVLLLLLGVQGGGGGGEVTQEGDLLLDLVGEEADERAEGIHEPEAGVGWKDDIMEERKRERDFM